MQGDIHLVRAEPARRAGDRFLLAHQPLTGYQRRPQGWCTGTSSRRTAYRRRPAAKLEGLGSDAYGCSGLSVRPFFMFAQTPLELSRSVDVGTVFDGQDSEHVTLVVNAVDHTIVAAPGAVQPG